MTVFRTHSHFGICTTMPDYVSLCLALPCSPLSLDLSLSFSLSLSLFLSLSLYIYICVCVYMCIYIYILHTYTYIICRCMRACVCAYVYARVCVCMCVCGWCMAAWLTMGGESKRKTRVCVFEARCLEQHEQWYL